MIEIDGVIKQYGDRKVVDEVSLTVEKGAFCVLLGTSGCGKSTLLKMVNRLIPTTGGTIRIGGEDISTVPPEQLRRRIGYAIQSTGLFPHWSVEDNIATAPAEMAGSTDPRPRGRAARDAASRAGDLSPEMAV